MSRKTSSRRAPAPRGGRSGSHERNEVRIIGGEWRGRRIAFTPVETLRPTPDRVRETLFNWLQPVVRGSRCLDLFAGSGALGLEALSRGAAHVVFVDRERRVAERLREALTELNCPRADVRQERAEDFLRSTVRTFDLVFLDPPFRSDVTRELGRQLEERGWLAPEAHIYIETPARSSPVLPENWTLLRSKRAGEVGYHLAQRHEAAVPAREGT